MVYKRYHQPSSAANIIIQGVSYQPYCVYAFTLSWRPSKKEVGSDTYVDLLPLADVADEAREAEEADEREQLGQPQDAQRPTRVQDLEALRVLLQRDKQSYFYQSLAIYFGDDIKKFSPSPLRCLHIHSISHH